MSSDKITKPSGPYASVEKQELRRTLIYAFLTSGVFTAARVREFIDHWNAVYADDNSKHPLWCIRPSSSGKTEGQMLKANADNLSDRMKNMWWYCASHITDVQDIEVLQLICIQCGYVPFDSKEECWEFLSSLAFGPMDESEDLPEAGVSRGVRDKDEVLPEPPEGMGFNFGDEHGPKRPKGSADGNSGATEKPLESMELEEVRNYAKSLEKALKLKEGPPKTPTSNEGNITALLSPLVSSLQMLTERMGDSAEANKAKAADSGGAAPESADQKAAKRLVKLTRWDAHLNAAEKLTDAEMAREEEEDTIRSAQEVRKKQGSTPMVIAYNLAIDDQTNCKVKVLRCNTIAEMDQSLFSQSELQEMEADLLHYQRRLRALRTKIATIQRAMRDEQLGKSDVASATMELLAKEEGGEVINPTAKRIHDAAKARVKEDTTLASMQAMASFQVSQSQMQAQLKTLSQNFSAAAPTGLATWQQAGLKLADGGKGGGGKGGGKGLSNRQTNPKLRHVDGEVYHADLKGFVAPDPTQYPVDLKWDMSSPHQGIVHKPTDIPIWPGKCECGVTGHQRSECPANKWTNGDGKTQVNWRWLFANKYCNGMGKPQ